MTGSGRRGPKIPTTAADAKRELALLKQRILRGENVAKTHTLMRFFETVRLWIVELRGDGRDRSRRRLLFNTSGLTLGTLASLPPGRIRPRPQHSRDGSRRLSLQSFSSWARQCRRPAPALADRRSRRGRWRQPHVQNSLRGRQGSGMNLREGTAAAAPFGPDQYCPPSRRVTAWLGRRERTGFKKLSSTYTRVDSLARSCGCSRLHFARRSHLPRQTITSSS